MIDLYEKFASDRYSTPIANIIRSFTAATEEITPSFKSDSSTLFERVYELLFNMSYVYQFEDVLLAELQLQPLIDTHVYRYQRQHHVTGRHHVTVLEHIDQQTYRNVAVDIVVGNDTGNTVATLAVTDSIKRWAQLQTVTLRNGNTAAAGSGNHVFQVRIASPSYVDNVTAFDEELEGLTDPLLVVFSNDRKRRKTEERELHEMESHELEVALEGAEISYLDDEVDDVDEKYSDQNDSEIVDATEHHPDVGLGEAWERLSGTRPTELSSTNVISTMSGRGFGDLIDDLDGERKYMSHQVRRGRDAHQTEPDRHSESSLGLSPSSSLHSLSPSYNSTRLRRSAGERDNKKRLKNAPGVAEARRGKNPCRRRPMYINFADIHWDNWIIAPIGYQAYECVGQCNFPLNDHLTPTKYALVKSLVQAMYGPRKSRQLSPVCCVPTRLEPISILYIDEHGTITYKYRYDGMVVAECGCR